LPNGFEARIAFNPISPTEFFTDHPFIQKLSIPLTDRSVKKMVTLGMAEEMQIADAEVQPHGEAFVAVLRSADGSIRARGFGPTPEAALEDLHTSLH
jgi:hypothetical protein